ncbi:MAG: helix-hairpin-helix domain-containing protein [Cardiobacteriaceae bacterium]|nr:helix-hairpin-helix domain-containing protein [Cardiobacteriaceae bacterium]
MHPAKVSRARLQWLTDLPNVGAATAADLQALGIKRPQDLHGMDALALYHALCERQGARMDPCMLDVFLSLEDFMAGGEARAWWHYTAERKRRYPQV